MGRRSEKEDGPARHAGADLSLVLSLSLLAGGVASYPSLAAATEATGDTGALLEAVTLFLASSLVAMIGFGIVALMFQHSRASGAPEKDAEHDEPARDQPVTAASIERGPGDQAGAIDQVLAPTDALIHGGGPGP